MRRRDRSIVYDEVSVAVSDLPAELRPPLGLISDSELLVIGDIEAKAELERREKVREEHVKAGRVRYVFLADGFEGRSLWWMHRAPTRDKKIGTGYSEGQPCESPSQGIAMALMVLEHHDEGGVIYADDYGDKPQKIIDLRPNECEYLALHGKHDWSYVPTGDDICRSCGLIV